MSRDNPMYVQDADRKSQDADRKSQDMVCSKPRIHITFGSSCVLLRLCVQIRRHARLYDVMWRRARAMVVRSALCTSCAFSVISLHHVFFARSFESVVSSLYNSHSL